MYFLNKVFLTTCISPLLYNTYQSLYSNSGTQLTCFPIDTAILTVLTSKPDFLQILVNQNGWNCRNHDWGTTNLLVF